MIFAPTGRAREGDLEDDSEAQHFSAGDGDQDIAFDPAEFTAAASTPPAVGRASDVSKLRVTTAAALAGGSVGAATVASFSPDAFVTGMVVQHPEYGLGKIIDLEGHGAKRTATVQFATAGAKKFLLLHSPLAPARPV